MTECRAGEPPARAGGRSDIALGPGKGAGPILLAGGPAREDRVAALFDGVELRRRHRQHATDAGAYQGRRLSRTTSGMGHPLDRVS